MSLHRNAGLFSVNGPPGTGKSTLLRDVISGIIFKRAKALSEFNKAQDAFQNSHSVSIERYKYKVWQLDPSLMGQDIVIASINYNAVENITKEIPRTSEIDSKDDDSWGLGAAVLGNKTNCISFFDKFWEKTPNSNNNKNSDKNHDKYGLNYLLNNIRPKSDWSECRNKFLATEKKFNSLINEIQQLSEAITNIKVIQDELDKFVLDMEELSKHIKLSEEKVKNYTTQLSSLESLIISKNKQLISIKTMQPPWYVVLLDIFLRGTNYKDWNAKCVSIIDELESSSKEKDRISIEITKLQLEINKLEVACNELKTEKAKKHHKLSEYQDIVTNMQNKYQWHSPIADDNLWSLPDAELQMQSPWIHKELQDIRAQLFVDAMNLHKSFIINSSNYITNNLKSIKYMMTSGYWPAKSYDLLPHIWATFF